MPIFHKSFIAVSLVVSLWADTVMAQNTLPTCGSFPPGAESYTCTCKAGFVVGGVWGTHIYTTDSSICAAAQHAGAITADGGVVKAVAAPGQADYPASTQNGVTSQHWGAFDQSFMFVAPGAGFAATTPKPLAEVAACTTLVQSGEDRVTCSCAKASTRSGGVWGSGPYTADSDICAAAQHAGVISPNGGTVTALRGPSVPTYHGSTANGVTSSDWQSFDSSLFFDHN